MGDTGPVSQCYDVLPLRAEPGTRRPSSLPAPADGEHPEPAPDRDTVDAGRMTAARLGVRRRGR